LKNEVNDDTVKPVEKTETQKPKRPFIPLSWEHHHGLSLVWRIQRGIERKTSPEVILSYVLPFWERNVSPHFDSEERILLPLVSREDPKVLRLLDDHRELRSQMGALKNGGPGDGIIELLQSMAVLLERHIRFEERELFPWITGLLLPETRDAVEKELREAFHPLVEPETSVFWE
jgi:hemerythrin-like domain-containing protein